MAFLGRSIVMAGQALLCPSNRGQTILPVIERIFALDRHHSTKRKGSQRRKPKDIKTTILVLTYEDIIVKSKLLREISCKLCSRLVVFPRRAHPAHDPRELARDMLASGQFKSPRFFGKTSTILCVGDEVDVSAI